MKCFKQNSSRVIDRTLHHRRPMFEQLEKRVVLASDLAAVAMLDVIDSTEMIDQDLVPAEVCCELSFQNAASEAQQIGAPAETPGDHGQIGSPADWSAEQTAIAEDLIQFRMQATDQLNFERSLEVRKDSDSFVISTDGQSTATIELKELTGIDDLDLRVEVLDSAGKSVARGSTNEMVELQFTADAGEHYRVTVDEACGQMVDYSVSITTEQVEIVEDVIPDELTDGRQANCDLPGDDSSVDPEPGSLIENSDDLPPVDDGGDCNVALNDDLEDLIPDATAEVPSETSLEDVVVCEIAPEELDHTVVENGSDCSDVSPDLGRDLIVNESDVPAELASCETIDVSTVARDCGFDIGIMESLGDELAALTEAIVSIDQQPMISTNIGNYFNFETMNFIGTQNVDQLLSGGSTYDAVTISAPMRDATFTNVEAETYAPRTSELRQSIVQRRAVDQDNAEPFELATIDRLFAQWPSNVWLGDA